jgi:Zn-dependent peptidase ImmA (M78 family)
MFRRGFKTWAEEVARRIRRELGLEVSSPLDPLQIAKHLGVLVLTPSDLRDLASDVRSRLLGDHSDSWSAITVSLGASHLIIRNSRHAQTRQKSSLAHELAHIILGHDPSLLFVTPKSGIALRTHNREQEEEANWLAGCLLLPREALFSIRRHRLCDGDACDKYGVSLAMLRFRFNTSGVDLQLRRGRR